MIRPLGIHEKNVFDKKRTAKAHGVHKKVRGAIQDGASRGEELLKLLRELGEEKIGIDRALALAKAGIVIGAAEFALKIADIHSIELARRGRNHSFNKVIQELGDFEKQCRIRFNATLGLLSFSNPAPRVHQPERMRRDAWRFIRTLRKMDLLLIQFDKLHSTRARLHALVHHYDADDNDQEAVEWIERTILDLREGLSKIRETLGNVDYPFAHGTAGMTMGEYVVDRIPSEKDIESLLRASDESLNRFYRSRRRLVGRLACIAEIMEASLGLPPLKGAPLAMNWSDLATPEGAKSPPSENAAKNRAISSPESRMGTLLQKTRARFGAAPRSFSPGRRFYNHIRMPSHIRDIANGAYKIIYQNQELLMREGRIVWGHIVQANSLLFKPGPEDCPAAAVFSLDPWFDDHLPELGSIADVLYQLKGEDTGDPAKDSFAENLRDDYSPVFSAILPKAISGSVPAHYTAFMVHRKHLPVNHLNSVWIPLLIHPTKTSASMILPAKYWDTDLINYWL